VAKIEGFLTNPHDHTMNFVCCGNTPANANGFKAE
jgi:hypothetical protein